MFAEPSTLTVPAESEQATIVRQFVRLACHRYGCDGITDSILQVTDELVANAFAHGGGPEDTVEVGIIPTQRGVRVEVHDHSHGRPALSDAEAAAGPPTVSSPIGGLAIVQSLAAEWGVADDADGTTVWAEMTDGA
jgi:anti-sigma regulatory factor (Ser/Thr protein kinase)